MIKTEYFLKLISNDMLKDCLTKLLNMMVEKNLTEIEIGSVVVKRGRKLVIR